MPPVHVMPPSLPPRKIPRISKVLKQFSLADNSDDSDSERKEGLLSSFGRNMGDKLRHRVRTMVCSMRCLTGP